MNSITLNSVIFSFCLIQIYCKHWRLSNSSLTVIFVRCSYAPMPCISKHQGLGISCSLPVFGEAKILAWKNLQVSMVSWLEGLWMIQWCFDDGSLMLVARVWMTFLVTIYLQCCSFFPLITALQVVYETYWQYKKPLHDSCQQFLHPQVKFKVEPHKW